MKYTTTLPYQNTRMGNSSEDAYQFCIVKLKSGDYELLSSKAPEKNVPAEYSKHIALGSLDSLIQIRGEIRRGIRNVDGTLKY